MFTLPQARQVMTELRPSIDDLIARRADLAELRVDLDAGKSSPLGGLPEAKALEAQVYAVLEEVSVRGVQLKGWAPVLLDFPGEHDGHQVLWCWLEGDTEIEWYHRIECGFAGRRRI